MMRTATAMATAVFALGGGLAATTGASAPAVPAQHTSVVAFNWWHGNHERNAYYAPTAAEPKSPAQRLDAADGRRGGSPPPPPPALGSAASDSVPQPTPRPRPDSPGA